MSDIRQITPVMVKKLNEPLPPEAIKQHPTKSFLSTINAMYVIERLNTVFGLGGWNFEIDVIESEEKHKVVQVTMYFGDWDMLPLTQFGGNDNKDVGDAYKGAVTDAVTKIGSYLGIGADVFKGIHDKDGVAPSGPTKRAAKKPVENFDTINSDPLDEED